MNRVRERTSSAGGRKKRVPMLSVVSRYPTRSGPSRTRVELFTRKKKTRSPLETLAYIGSGDGATCTSSPWTNLASHLGRRGAVLSRRAGPRCPPGACRTRRRRRQRSRCPSDRSKPRFLRGNCFPAWPSMSAGPPGIAAYRSSPLRLQGRSGRRMRPRWRWRQEFWTSWTS